MTTRTALPAVAYDRVRVGRRLAFVFAIAVCATGLGVAAPTALGQTASVEPGAEYDTLGADSCIGPANPEGSAPFIR